MQTESFNATLAYGRMVLAMLFVANLLHAGSGGELAAILATAAAYFSQGLFTRALELADDLATREAAIRADKAARNLRWASIGFSLLAGWALL